MYLLAPLIAAALLLPLNPAEEAALARYCATQARGEPLIRQVELAREMLDRLQDPRYPDTVSTLLAGCPLTPASKDELDQALWAVRLAEMGGDAPGRDF